MESLCLLKNQKYADTHVINRRAVRIIRVAVERIGAKERRHHGKKCGQNKK